MVLVFDMFWLNDSSLEFEDRPFLITDNETITYSDAFDQSDKIWSGREKGLALIICNKSVSTILAYLGALRAKIVPLLIGSDFNMAVLENYILNYEPNYIFSEKKIDYQGYSRTTCNNLYYKVTNTNIIPHKDLALLLPTSGSTGDPKCVRLSESALNTCTQAICSYLEMSTSRTCVTILPLHYSYGLSVLNTVIASRASIVVTETSVIDREFWNLIIKHQISDLSGVPFTFEALRRFKFSSEILSSLKYVTQAGGKLNNKLTKYFNELFAMADVKYFTMYGQTEAGPRISYLAPEFFESKLGSVGVPINCGQAYLRETNTKIGEGELQYRGPNVCMGYSKSRIEISRGDDLKGILNTGDMVRIDEDGFIFIVGRRKRYIKLQGISVNLDYVEEILKMEINHCAVVGEENKIIIFHTDSNKEDIECVLKNNFNFNPINIRIKKVGNIPLNSSSKIDYKYLEKVYL